MLLMESQPQKLMLFGCVQHCQFFEVENRQIFQKENVSTNMKRKEIVKDLIRISIKLVFFLYTRTHAHREYTISNRCTLKFATNIFHISSERTFLWSKFKRFSYSTKEVLFAEIKYSHIQEYRHSKFKIFSGVKFLAISSEPVTINFLRASIPGIY